MKSLKSAEKLAGWLGFVGLERLKLPTLPCSVLVLVIGIAILAGFYFQQNNFNKSLADLGGSPTGAEYYFKTAQLAAERKDFGLAKDLYEKGVKFVGDNEQILGLASEVWVVVFPEKVIEEEIKYWETTVEEQPTYRDGWLKLAVLNLQLGNTSQAVEYWRKAQEIDPNNEEVEEVGVLFEKN